jgi:trehalose 6-phosphate synthase/phosphatase
MRLLIVSNRLPVTLKHKDGEFLFEKSAGGLVSGLGDYLASLKDSSLKINEYLWLGWPGMTVKKQFREPVRENVQNDFNSLSRIFTPKSYEQFLPWFLQ